MSYELTNAAQLAAVQSALGTERRPNENIWTQRIFGSGWGNCGDNNTFQLIRGVPFVGEDVYVRAGFVNDTPSPVSVTYNSFSASATFGSNPVLIGGGASPWTAPVSASIPAASASWSTDGQFGVGYTDWKKVTIPAREDGGTFGLLYHRFYSSTPFRGPVGVSYHHFNTYPTNINEIIRSDYQAGVEYVTTNQTSFTPTAGAGTNSEFMPAFIQIMSARQSIVAGIAGDSTSAGYGTDGNHNSFLNKACRALSTIAKPVVLATQAYAGKGSSYYTGAATTWIADQLQRPDILFIQPYSQNDGTFNQANCDAGYARALLLAQRCKAFGIIPVLMTLAPTTFITTSGQDAFRIALNNAIRSGPYAYLDIDAVFSDGASPARIIAAYTVDGVHHSEAGDNALVAPTVAIMQTMLARIGL